MRGHMRTPGAMLLECCPYINSHTDVSMRIGLKWIYKQNENLTSVNLTMPALDL